MTLVNAETGELIEPMDVDSARRLTERLRLATANYAEAKAKVLALVDEAKAGAAHIALGYKSWTAYLSDVLSDEPLRLAREERDELVARLADEGMTTRAIAPIVGVNHSTVVRALDSAGANAPADGSPTVVRVTTGLDGRERVSVVSGGPRKPVTERNFQEAELVTAFRVSIRPLLKPKNVSTLSPRARALLIDLMQEAIDTLKEADE